MKMNAGIFKAYDIRGKYPSEVNEEVAERVGRAAATYFRKKSRKRRPRIIVATDLRLSSPMLFKSLVRGLMSEDAEVWNGGIGTTPYFYFLLGVLKPDGGIMVTASHSPAEYNGFKFQDHKLHAVSLGSGLEVIKKCALEKKFSPSVSLAGSIKNLPDLSKKYLDYISKGFSVWPIRVVIDTAGGAESLFMSRLLDRFPAIVYRPLFFEADGSFRSHSPNPILPEAQKYVRAELKKGPFHFGAVFDGDSDRIIFLDEKGEAIRADFIFALLAEIELKKKRNAVFVVTLNTSKSVREHIEERGGIIKVSPQGYPYLQERMRRYGAIAGVELSGHYHFKKTFFRDSTLLPFLMLAEHLSKTKEPLSLIIRKLERYVSSNEMAFPATDKKALMEKIKKAHVGKGGRISFLDGITVEYPDWWFNLRPSHTEPLVRLVVEAKDKKLYDEKLKEVESLIKR